MCSNISLLLSFKTRQDGDGVKYNVDSCRIITRFQVSFWPRLSPGHSWMSLQHSPNTSLDGKGTLLCIHLLTILSQTVLLLPSVLYNHHSLHQACCDCRPIPWHDMACPSHVSCMVCLPIAVPIRPLSLRQEHPPRTHPLAPSDYCSYCS